MFLPIPAAIFFPKTKRIHVDSQKLLGDAKTPDALKEAGNGNDRLLIGTTIWILSTLNVEPPTLLKRLPFVALGHADRLAERRA